MQINLQIVYYIIMGNILVDLLQLHLNRTKQTEKILDFLQLNIGALIHSTLLDFCHCHTEQKMIFKKKIGNKNESHRIKNATC